MVDGAVAGFEDYEDAIAAYPAHALDDEPAGTFMLYSSGTTGRPKGILRPLPPNKINDDAGPIGALQRQLWNFDAEHRVSVARAAVSLRAARLLDRTQALGGTVVMMPKFDPLLALRGDRRTIASRTASGCRRCSRAC